MENIIITNLSKLVESNSYMSFMETISLILIIIVWIYVKRLIKTVRYIDIFQRAMHHGITKMNGGGAVYKKAHTEELNNIMEREKFIK